MSSCYMRSVEVIYDNMKVNILINLIKCYFNYHFMMLATCLLTINMLLMLLMLCGSIGSTELCQLPSLDVKLVLEWRHDSHPEEAEEDLHRDHGPRRCA